MSDSGMRQARPTEADFDAVLDFFNELEAVIEGEDAREDDDVDIDMWLSGLWDKVTNHWRRAVFGGQVAVVNACDPTCGHLEFKKELKDAVAQLNSAWGWLMEIAQHSDAGCAALRETRGDRDLNAIKAALDAAGGAE